LSRRFYDRPTLEVARDLLGLVLVHRVGSVTTAGAIVEVEAYIGESDPACHAACGPTRRNAPLYGTPGLAYVYLSYGVHCLMNVVTEPAGSPAAVLIRALEPVEGLATMRRRRRRGAKGLPGRRDFDDAALCRGPGNLSRAMGITLRHTGANVCGGRLYVEDGGRAVGRVAWTSRIGIRVGTDRPWRAYVVGSEAVSGPQAAGGRRV
jgi:DNA-3-methyladenine glycosylase